MLRRAISFVMAVGAWCVTASAESFSDFFATFFFRPYEQAEKVQYPFVMGADVTKVKSGWQGIFLKNKNKIVVVCADSVNAVAEKGEAKVRVLDSRGKMGAEYGFKAKGESWRLTEGRSVGAEEFKDKGFYAFLEQFCGEQSYQMRHIVFPIKELTYHTDAKTGKETQVAGQLFMPKTWQKVDILGGTSQICWFDTGDEYNTNREIVYYVNGKKSLCYNFINIRGNWYLIEVQRYEK